MTRRPRRRRPPASRYPAWARYGLDVGLLVTGAAGVRRRQRAAGYQLVLAPEGVPTISVSYWAFAGPALLWIGAGLLTWRLTDLLLGRGRPLAAPVRPAAGDLCRSPPRPRCAAAAAR